MAERLKGRPLSEVLIDGSAVVGNLKGLELGESDRLLPDGSVVERLKLSDFHIILSPFDDLTWGCSAKGELEGYQFDWSTSMRYRSAGEALNYFHRALAVFVLDVRRKMEVGVKS